MPTTADESHEDRTQSFVALTKGTIDVELYIDRATEIDRKIQGEGK